MLGEVEIQEDVKMYIKLHDYHNCHGFDLSKELELLVITKEFVTGSPKPSWRPPKRPIFNARIPNELFKSIRENAMGDKKDEFDQYMSFLGVSEIPISKTPIDLAAMDFADYDDQATFRHLKETCARYHMITFIGTKTKTEQTVGKVEMQSYPQMG